MSAPPALILTVTPDEGEPTLAVTATGSTPDSPGTWDFYWGDGTADLGDGDGVANHNYTDAGRYRVVCRFTETATSLWAEREAYVQVYRDAPTPTPPPEGTVAPRSDHRPLDPTRPAFTVRRKSRIGA